MADLPNVHHEQIAEFKHIATSNNDTSVLMLNLNRYTEDASYPDETYKEYMAVLSTLLEEVGGKILWRTHVHGCVVGNKTFMRRWASGIEPPGIPKFDDCAFIREEHGA